MPTSACSLLLMFVLFSCGGPPTLTDQELAKLDPYLHALITEGTVPAERYDMTLRPDGTREYGIIIRTTSVDSLRAAGVRVQSVFGDVVTARVSVDELRNIVRLPSVRAVQSGGKNTLHNSMLTPTSERQHS
jgi:hypothetical protein